MIWRLIGLALVGHAHAGEPISGIARIIDGDTLAIGETKIRLEGIDAPESDQVCLDRNAAKWSCGISQLKRPYLATSAGPRHLCVAGSR
jgi:hypothetical protein